MTYQITYFSPDGHAERLAKALMPILPRDTVVGQIQPDQEPAADVQIVGIELKFADMDKPAKEVTQYLRKLTDRTVLLYVTLPVFTDESHNSRIHKKAAQALPADCDYRGLFLSMAQPPEKLLEGFHHAVQVKPDNRRVQHWCERCERAVGHPNGEDEAAFRNFAAHVLNIKE